MVDIGGVLVLSNKAPSACELYYEYKGKKAPITWGLKSDQMEILHPNSPNSGCARFAFSVPLTDTFDILLKVNDTIELRLASIQHNLLEVHHGQYAYYREDQWVESWSSELDFWKRWMETKGLRWQEDFQTRSSSDLQLPEIIEKRLLNGGFYPNSPISILDIGSGPLTLVGSKSSIFNNIQVTPVDPLADFYNDMLIEHQINAPNPTLKGSVESLQHIFEPKSFDFVWSCNSLDHSYDPMSGLFSILSLLKDNGIAAIVFHPKEATHGNYEGLHQWDFFINENDEFIIERMNMNLNISKLFWKHFKISLIINGDKNKPKSRLYVIFQKIRDFNVTEIIGLNYKGEV